MMKYKFIKQPFNIKVFADHAHKSNYLPVVFGTDIAIMQDNYEDVAKLHAFSHGAEASCPTMQMKDYNSLFYYFSNLIKYLYQQGIAPYNPYQAYPKGALVTYEGGLWIAKKEIAPLRHFHGGECKHQHHHGHHNGCGCGEHTTGSLNDKEYDESTPSKDHGWGNIVDLTDYLTSGIVEVKDEETGSIDYQVTNPDGSTLTLQGNHASIELTDSADASIGFALAESDKTGKPTSTLKLVAFNDLSTTKGFVFNTEAKQWEVTLEALVDNSSIEFKDGKLSVKQSYMDAFEDKITEATNGNNDALNKTIADLKAKLEKDISNNSSKIESLTTKVTAVEKNVSTIESKVTEITNTITNNNNSNASDIKELQKQINENYKNISALTANESVQDAKIALVTKNTDANAANITSILEAFNNVDATLNQYHREILAIEKALHELSVNGGGSNSTQVANNTLNIESNKKAIEANTKAIAELNAKLQALIDSGSTGGGSITATVVELTPDENSMNGVGAVYYGDRTVTMGKPPRFVQLAGKDVNNNDVTVVVGDYKGIVKATK